MRDIWQLSKISKSHPQDANPPREMTVADFRVPFRHTLALWFAKWEVPIVVTLAGLAILATFWWLP
jgi:hypothetical protein